MSKINLYNFDDRLKMREILLDAYNKQMPKTGEFVMSIDEYGNTQEDDEEGDHSLLMEFLEEVFGYETENEKVTIFIIQENHGVTINLVKDFSPYD